MSLIPRAESFSRLKVSQGWNCLSTPGLKVSQGWNCLSWKCLTAESVFWSQGCKFLTVETVSGLKVSSRLWFGKAINFAAFTKFLFGYDRKVHFLLDFNLDSKRHDYPKHQLYGTAATTMWNSIHIRQRPLGWPFSKPFSNSKETKSTKQQSGT